MYERINDYGTDPFSKTTTRTPTTTNNNTSTHLAAIQRDDGDDIADDAHKQEEDGHNLGRRGHSLCVTVPGATGERRDGEGALGPNQAKVAPVRHHCSSAVLETT